ncbi:ferritin-like domain-containing protein [Maribacter thermophilus]|uniref:ferritin-like domain-containing protein n=1 Tax=Maribacter thermophilus TaxID=1197874 RepID=UPI0006416A92|nr:PA2169 family four-helix-bundle protein [Maribacter thermophilus]
MNTYSETVGNKLNDILEKTYDAEKGFKKAAEHTNNTALKSYFKDKAAQRYNFGHVLKTEIKSFGHEVEEGDSFTGKAHRAWMDVKALFANDNEEAMLEEAIRGEKASVEEYDEVIKDGSLPTSTLQILKNQKTAIENGLANIRTLEDLA